MSHEAGWMHDVYDLLGALAGLVLAWAAVLKAWASYREVGLKETARRGYRSVRYSLGGKR